MASIGETRVRFRVQTTVSVFEEDGQFVAYCEPLDLASQGDTPEQAHSRLGEAVRLFIDSCFERGTLEQVLSERQFTLQLASSPASEPVRQSQRRQAVSYDMVDLPIPLELGHGPQVAQA